MTLWLPLALLGLWVGEIIARYLDGPGASGSFVRATPLVASFFLACFASSTLVGRFGSRAGRKEAVGANLLGSALTLSFAATSSDLPAVVREVNGQWQRQ